MTGKPWIQSLLLTSGHSPSLKTISRLPHDNAVTDKHVSPPPFSLSVGESIQTTSTTQMSAGRPLAEVIDEHGTFWPFTQYTTRSRIEILGNGCVVSKFPARISFVLSTIVCGTGDIDFSWIIEETSTQTGSTSEILASSPKSLQWTNLTTLEALSTTTSLKIATAKEAISVTFEHTGLYFIVARLDGIEYGRIALSVTSI